MEHNLDYKSKPLYRNYQKSALSRKLEFNLSVEDFDRITIQSCTYCGKEGPNGIDRVDSIKGYSVDNCVPACKHCNYVKGNLSQEDFNKWVSRFVDFQNKKSSTN